jgi:uncharacterized protein YegP (UPF0339 family)
MRIELYKDRKGEWRWRARHTNGRILADSGEGYKRKRDAVKGLQRLAVSLGPAVEAMS